jgi:hypothetical protein
MDMPRHFHVVFDVRILDLNLPNFIFLWIWLVLELGLQLGLGVRIGVGFGLVQWVSYIAILHLFHLPKMTSRQFGRWKRQTSADLWQGCKLLSDIGQCPTKFGKCPSKSNFDRTLVRSQKKLSHCTFFCCDKIRLQIHSICILQQNLRGILAFYLTLRRNGYTYLSRDLYISCDVYCICPTKFSSVGFCPTKFKLCPTKIKSDRTNVLSSQISICSPGILTGGTKLINLVCWQDNS